jgi:phosphatidylserine decarboxylase
MRERQFVEGAGQSQSQKDDQRDAAAAALGSASATVETRVGPEKRPQSGAGTPSLLPFQASGGGIKMPPVKHRGKATQACLKLILWSLIGLVVLVAAGVVAVFFSRLIAAVAGVLAGLWIVFSLFCLWFFRDPTPVVPSAAGLILAPGHGKVDVVDEMTEPEFLAGPCKRVSIFLSVFDVHVQVAPVAGKVAYLRHHPGQFLNAMRLDSAAVNENVMIGFESPEVPGQRVGLRLIAGVIARRIVPWAAVGDAVKRGERVSLIQFGSRLDVYLPPTVRLQVKVGDRVRGGETVLATTQG